MDVGNECGGDIDADSSATLQDVPRKRYSDYDRSRASSDLVQGVFLKHWASVASLPHYGVASELFGAFYREL